MKKALSLTTLFTLILVSLASHGEDLPTIDQVESLNRLAINPERNLDQENIQRFELVNRALRALRLPELDASRESSPGVPSLAATANQTHVTKRKIIVAKLPSRGAVPRLDVGVLIGELQNGVSLIVDCFGFMNLVPTRDVTRMTPVLKPSIVRRGPVIYHTVGQLTVDGREMFVLTRNLTVDLYIPEIARLTIEDIKLLSISGKSELITGFRVDSSDNHTFFVGRNLLLGPSIRDYRVEYKFSDGSLGDPTGWAYAPNSSAQVDFMRVQPKYHLTPGQMLTPLPPPGRVVLLKDQGVVDSILMVTPSGWAVSANHGLLAPGTYSETVTDQRRGEWITQHNNDSQKINRVAQRFADGTIQLENGEILTPGGFSIGATLISRVASACWRWLMDTTASGR